MLAHQSSASIVQSLLFDKFHQEGKAFVRLSCTKSHQPFARDVAPISSGKGIRAFLC
jgi:hypothetical protein